MMTEQLQAATSLFPIATDENELEIILGWARDESDLLDIEENPQEFKQLIAAMLERIRNCDFMYAENNEQFPELLTSEKFFHFLRNLYFSEETDDSRLAVEAFHCVGYLLNYNYNEAFFTKVIDFVCQNPDRSLYFFERSDTATMMFQLLFSISFDFPEKWQGAVPLKEFLYDFLLSGKTDPEKILNVTQKLELDAWFGDIVYLNGFFEMLGFTVEEERAIKESWKTVFHEIDTELESIIPNIRMLIVLAAAYLEAPKILHRIYGIKMFTRYAIEQLSYQYQLYEKVLNAESEEDLRPVIYAFTTDDDGNGTSLGKRALWEKVRKLANEQGMDFVVAEVGQSAEEIVERIQQVQKIHGKSQQVIYSTHAHEGGWVLKWKNEIENEAVSEETTDLSVSSSIGGYWHLLSQDEIQASVTPAIMELLDENGVIVLNMCNSSFFTECFPDAQVVFNEGVTVGEMVDVAPGEQMPLTPVFANYD